MNLHTCNECGLETVFSSGLCSDCQLRPARSIPDIVTDFHIEVNSAPSKRSEEKTNG